MCARSESGNFEFASGRAQGPKGERGWRIEERERRKRNERKGRLRVGAGEGSAERGSTTPVLKVEQANEHERDEERVREGGGEERKTEREK